MLSPVNNNGADGLQVSLAKWAGIIERTECADFLRFAGHLLSGSHVQAQQCKALAAVALVSPEAVRQWLHGTSQPEWHRMFAVFVAVRARFDSDLAMQSAFTGDA